MGWSPLCKFKGINTYENPHWENTKASLTRQGKCMTSISIDKKINDLFQCLPPVKDMIENFQDDNFEIIEICAYEYTLKCIDILP